MVPKIRERTVAKVHLMYCAINGPIEIHGAKSWGRGRCICGERGAKPLDGGVVVAHLLVVARMVVAMLLVFVRAA